MEELVVMYLISRLDVLNFTAGFLLVASVTSLLIIIGSGCDNVFNYEKESYATVIRVILIIMAISFFILLFVPNEREAYQLYTNTYIPESIDKSGGN
jgi:hypothetical protein